MYGNRPRSLENNASGRKLKHTLSCSLGVDVYVPHSLKFQCISKTLRKSSILLNASVRPFPNIVLKTERRPITSLSTL